VTSPAADEAILNVWRGSSGTVGKDDVVDEALLCGLSEAAVGQLDVANMSATLADSLDECSGPNMLRYRLAEA